MALTISTAELVGVFVESLAYGVYLMIFVRCITALRSRSSKPSFYLLTTTIALFIFATMHLVIDILRSIWAYASEVPDYPMQYYSHFGTWDPIFRSGIYVAITLISDAFILYRCFIIWSRSYLVTIIPFLFFLADIVAGILCTYDLSLGRPGKTAVADVLVAVRIFYIATLATNVICTILIAYKIWAIQRAFTGNEKYLTRLVTIIVESGFVYSAMLVVIIATCWARSPVMIIFLDPLCPIIGIVFSSVIVRVSTGISHGDTHHTKLLSSAQHRTTVSMRPTCSHHGVNQAPFTFPDGGAKVLLRQTVHTHIDGLPDGEVEVETGNVAGDEVQVVS